ncbi:protein Dok-7 [Fundulus heteroclitus]|uniref:protein Dok-7 n=1 Tax=Fundulus heteroclitus TaxID=8078 RepID=UPI00165CB8F6|nr:protein Dok-7 [Fundulus heteroclitus]
MTDTVVAEGQVKFRDGKKWKTRWVVLQKPSPVADCLTLLVCKEKRKGKSSGNKERLNVTLEGICGVEPGPGYDGVPYTLSILCLTRTLILGFKNRDALLAWDARIRYSLGEVHRFFVGVEPGTKLESGPATLHLCNNLLVLSRGLPPGVIGHWKLSALRRYGAVPNGFVFEGGTRCGFWAGVFFLSCSEGEQISFLFDCIVRGIAPSRALHGVPPDQPDPDADPASAEKRISQETSELEKRLSMLSQYSLASSSSSTYSCSTSVAGDDRSFSSSSSSQSDASYGSRFPFWVEQSVRSHLSSEAASSSSTLTALTRSDDGLHGAAREGSAGRRLSVQRQPWGLHDRDRQSSLDSGIGIAAGSHSSYSGSYSSCNGSLDMASQGGGEDNESGASPSAPLHPPSSPPPAPPPPTPPSSPLEPTITLEPRCPSRCAPQTPRRHSEEYQIPSLLRRWYDTPRSLLQALTLREPPAQKAPQDLGSKTGTGGGGGGGGGQEPTLMRGPRKPRAQRQWMMQRSLSWGSERAPPTDSEERTTPTDSEERTPPRAQGASGCPAPAEAQSRGPSLTDLSPPFSTKTQDSCVREKLGDRDDVAALKGLRKMCCSPPSVPPPPPPPPLTLGTTAACALFKSILKSHPSPSSGFHRDYGGNYVNIPNTALQATELLYSKLNLHGPAHESSPNRDVPQLYRHKDDSIRYAHLDIAAMETAHRVGAEHVQGREDRLTQLESRWRGPQN